MPIWAEDVLRDIWKCSRSEGFAEAGNAGGGFISWAPVTSWGMGAWSIFWLVKTAVVFLILSLGSSTFYRAGNTWFDGALSTHLNWGQTYPYCKRRLKSYQLGFSSFFDKGVTKGSVISSVEKGSIHLHPGPHPHLSWKFCLLLLLLTLIL